MIDDNAKTRPGSGNAATRAKARTKGSGSAGKRSATNGDMSNLLSELETELPWIERTKAKAGERVEQSARQSAKDAQAAGIGGPAPMKPREDGAPWQSSPASEAEEKNAADKSQEEDANATSSPATENGPAAGKTVTPPSAKKTTVSENQKTKPATPGDGAKPSRKKTAAQKENGGTKRKTSSTTAKNAGETRARAKRTATKRVGDGRDTTARKINRKSHDQVAMGGVPGPKQPGAERSKSAPTQTIIVEGLFEGLANTLGGGLGFVLDKGHNAIGGVINKGQSALGGVLSGVSSGVGWVGGLYRRARGGKPKKSGNLE